MTSRGVHRRQMTAAAWGLASCFAGEVLAADPSDLTDRVRTVLDTHCANCHQVGRIGPERPRTTLLNLLDLETLARDFSLVRPGFSDASPLYTLMLRRAMPPAPAGRPGVRSGPTDDEIQAVRDWIDALPANSARRCMVSRDAIDTTLTAAVSALDAQSAKTTRFIVATATADSCEGPDSGSRGQMVRLLVNALAPSGASDAVQPVGGSDMIFQVSLDRMGWTADDWEAVVAEHPDRTLPVSPSQKVVLAASGTAVPAVRADWLAHHLLRRASANLIQIPPEEYTRLASLAWTWERALDLEHAASEMGMSRAELVRQISAAPKHLQASGRQLMQGLLSRREFIALRAGLLGPQAPFEPRQAGADDARSGIDLALWSDKTEYRQGELLTLHARANVDCNLTLIGIDREGRAIVLFPNELEPDNQMKAGQILTIPGPAAAYQLRLSNQGQERVVGVCTVNARIADDIQLDFDRQRFALLGDWRTFIANAWKPVASPPQRADRRRRKGRAARRRQPPAPVKVERPRPEEHARTAISFEVR